MNPAFFVAALLVLLALTGCSSLGVKPMPDRLNDEQQAQIDAGWEHFIDQLAAHERQELLDAILLRKAWEAGVDRLALSSEKRVGDKTVFMETRVDRDHPEGDTFRVLVIDSDGALLQAESFTRADIDEAIALYLHGQDLPPDAAPEQAAAQRARSAERSARIAAAQRCFPLPAEAQEPNDAQP